MKTITAGELKLRLARQLMALDDSTEVMIGGGALSLYRLKQRGPNLVDIEFNEVFVIQVDPDDLS